MIAEAPPLPVLFVADCQPCDWQGPERTSNLRALADFDRHVARTHRPAPRVELCSDCRHPVDGHDLRGDPNDCEACDPGEPCYRGVFA